MAFNSDINDNITMLLGRAEKMLTYDEQLLTDNTMNCVKNIHSWVMKKQISTKKQRNAIKDIHDRWKQQHKNWKSCNYILRFDPENIWAIRFKERIEKGLPLSDKQHKTLYDIKWKFLHEERKMYANMS